MPRQLRVFLCHASQDKPAVRELYQRLKAEEWIDPWLDEEKLLGGQDFDLEIYKATRDADAIIICLSQKSVLKEGYVNKEIRRALDIAQEKREGTIYVIPLRLDDCYPTFEELKKLHWVDYFALNAHEKLLHSLRVRATDLKIKIPERNKTNPVEKRPISKLDLRRFGIGGIIVAAMFLGGLGLNSLFSQSPASTLTPTLPGFTETPVHLIPTSTPLPPTRTPTQLPSPPPSLGSSTKISEKDGMVLMFVPAGEFLMGSKDTDSSLYDDEKPQHTITLDAFWIDETEVTNAMYAKCVNAGECNPPGLTDHFDNSSYAKHPVAYVSWYMARTYCSWAGRELPTEAEWEKAARGTEGRIYPWGEAIEAIGCNKANYSGCIGDTSVTGSYPDGASIYGALDMSGNVWEWVNDWFSDTYYQSSPSLNPPGPSSGQYRVIRGGSWTSYLSDATSAVRYALFPAHTYYDLGFRCALSQP